jgi:hypothetical protein
MMPAREANFWARPPKSAMGPKRLSRMMLPWSVQNSLPSLVCRRVT